jgi:hypothetical protein
VKILALENELSGVAPQAFQPMLKAEAQCIWELQQAGRLREAYFRADQHTAVLVLECRNIEEVQSLLNDLPLVAAGLITFELIPLAPYDGLARLFA